MASALSEVGISDANDLRQLLHDPDDALATIAQFEEVNRINLELRLLKYLYLDISNFDILQQNMKCSPILVPSSSSTFTWFA